jgi:tungstate transport system substrate-binding protein
MDRPAADPRTLAPARRRARRLAVAACALACATSLLVAGCSSTSRSMPESALSEEATTPADSSRATIVLGTTTAVADTGLGDALAAGFGDRWSQYSVKVVSFPEGGAAVFASKGEADVMLVDGDAAAKALIAQGFAVRSAPLMEDRLVVIGPESDPAGVRKAATLGAALARIADAGRTLSAPGRIPVRFLGGVSSVEKAAWAKAGRTPAGGWYVAAGEKAARPVSAASEGQAYAIVSRALFLRDGGGAKGLAVLVDGGREFTTRYFVLPLAGASDPRGAGALSKWLAEDGRSVVASFGERGTGESPFTVAR